MDVVGIKVRGIHPQSNGDTCLNLNVAGIVNVIIPAGREIVTGCSTNGSGDSKHRRGNPSNGRYRGRDPGGRRQHDVREGNIKVGVDAAGGSTLGRGHLARAAPSRGGARNRAADRRAVRRALVAFHGPRRK